MVNGFDGFTVDCYKRLIDFILRYYEIRMFENYTDKSDKPILLLRHDIDVSIAKALDMAEIENDLGIKSTYFFMVESLLYNVDSKIGKAILLQVQELGHDIALHANEFINPEKLDADCDILEQIIGKKVTSFSIHRDYLDSDIVNGRIVACSPNLMTNYFADSRGVFKWPCFNSACDNREKSVSQFLFHPIWWGNNCQSSTNFIRFIQDAILDMKEAEVLKFIGGLTATLPKYFASQ